MRSSMYFSKSDLFIIENSAQFHFSEIRFLWKLRHAYVTQPIAFSFLTSYLHVFSSHRSESYSVISNILTEIYCTKFFSKYSSFSNSNSGIYDHCKN